MTININDLTSFSFALVYIFTVFIWGVKYNEYRKKLFDPPKIKLVWFLQSLSMVLFVAWPGINTGLLFVMWAAGSLNRTECK